jgi:Tol biopolymer transport system component
MPIKGGAPLQVTTGDNPNFVFDWSPYSDEISFHSFVDGVRTGAIVNTVDLRVARLPSTGLHDRYPVWLENENVVGVHREVAANKLDLYLAKRDENDVWIPGAMVQDDLAPGGRYSVVNDQYVFARHGSVWIWDTNSGESWVLEETQEHNAAYPMWSDDGTTIFFLSTVPSIIPFYGGLHQAYMSIPAIGGSVKMVVDLKGSNKTRYFGDIHRNHVFSTVSEVESDLWVIDLARQ